MRVVVAVVLLALLGVAACGEPSPPGSKDGGQQTDPDQRREDPGRGAAGQRQLYRLERVWENDDVRHESHLIEYRMGNHTWLRDDRRWLPEPASPVTNGFSITTAPFISHRIGMD